MNICIDGLGIKLLKGSGIYTYTYGLLNGLLEYYSQQKYYIIWDKVKNEEENQ
ncbi:hypothetical protein ACFIJ5_05500 [Haloimpatiens sp. FM7330]|uniref:hypothetical protein n=1 Tax=Haloimpatiens sp. FM7330 TaxID=3298610 RepID=UPI00363DAF5B